ncbi:hypothetical protein [Paenisporosarcina sp. NPDC076898]|uniref:hypothetical protein n=1 Tax=unclassified Paenisporosarcina TaxID=2642018 RepID=UPI003D010382
MRKGRVIKLPDLYVLIGEQNTRKSSTIRALSGFRDRSGGGLARPHYITFSNGQQEAFYIEPTSLQEKKIPSINVINEANNYDNVLLALREKSINNYPDYYEYLDDFITAGWRIVGLLVLGTNTLQRGLPSTISNVLYEPNSKNKSSNALAAQLRNSWQWL